MSKTIICKLITGETVIASLTPNEDGGLTMVNPFMPLIQRQPSAPSAEIEIKAEEAPKVGGVSITLVPIDTVFFFGKESTMEVIIEEPSNIVWQSNLSKFPKLETAYQEMLEKLKTQEKEMK